MSRIRSLPVDLQNKIAAGEVIERPASVVKELLENSLDAGARHIEVHVEDGGRTLIKIVDDGSGIEFEDLPLALAPHATSKLQQEDDLYHIQTMGFRGEALASIASISQLTLTSRPKDAATGGRIVADGGTFSEPAPAGCAPGTTIEVRNLFFNTPARRKFMKTAATEISHITEQVARIALVNPGVSFKVYHNAKSVYDLPAMETFRQRIADFFGPELSEALITVERQTDAVQMYALVSRPVDAKSSPRWQYTWLNGRYIRDRFIQHAVREAYRGLMDPSRQPVLFVYLQANPEDVDVNVHPTKIEVRWTDSGIVHGLILSALRETLLSHDNTPSLQVGAEDVGDVPGGPGAPQQKIRQAIADFFKETGPMQQQHLGYPRRGATSGTGMPSGPGGGGGGSYRPAGGFTPTAQNKPAPFGAEEFEKAFSSVTAAGPSTPSPSVQPEMPQIAEQVQQRPTHAIQIHNSFIVAETSEGMVVVDQHALHERVLYEQFRARVATGHMESQRLLLPETVNVPPDQVALVAERADLLARLGIEAAEFGPNTIAVQAFPSMVIGRVRIPEFMAEMLSKLGTAASNTNAEKLLDEVLNMMACKAAVKAGDPLTPQEISALLANWQNVEGSSNCPHGRPTVLKLSVADLEKQFHRT
ncbi:MAG TPA: DNA mismatch repair endonuclease MutL [Tepidisphaeraceae bacterium]|nr:DNA mismatch repair endonuclease MutL [Tepidisphaeraceae bacterium]